MSVKRQWLLVLAIIAIVSVLVHAFFINVLTKNTFNTYLNDSYKQHMQEIESYAVQVMSSETLSLAQMSMELETHLDEPIIRIQLVDSSGEVLIDVSRQMMGRMMRDNGKRDLDVYQGDVDVEKINLVKDGVTFGEIRVTHYSSISQSIEAENFQQKMLINTIISVAVVVIIALAIGYWISRRMGRDLMQTATFAEQLDEGVDQPTAISKVSEIHRIQQSLLSLRQKLRLKQKVRKTLLDELVHQTRTPLTILKTRLEALEDGVIPFTVEEASIMQQQVDALNTHLANVNQLIDANGESYALQPVHIEMHEFLTKIHAGLKPQFDRKGIEMMIDAAYMEIESDAHLLSQVVYNILTNAYKYTQVDGQVILSGKSHLDFYNIEIVDTGSGISPADLAHVFDAYYRGQHTAGIEGDGLGLYVAKQNIERLKASIFLTSQEGKGTKIILQIPKTM